MGACSKSGRPRGPGRALKNVGKNVGGEAPHIFEGFPGPPGPARPQQCTPENPARLPSGTQIGLQGCNLADIGSQTRKLGGKQKDPLPVWSNVSGNHKVPLSTRTKCLAPRMTPTPGDDRFCQESFFSPPPGPHGSDGPLSGGISVRVPGPRMTISDSNGCLWG